MSWDIRSFTLVIFEGFKKWCVSPQQSDRSSDHFGRSSFGKAMGTNESLEPEKIGPGIWRELSELGVLVAKNKTGFELTLPNEAVKACDEFDRTAYSSFDLEKGRGHIEGDDPMKVKCFGAGHNVECTGHLLLLPWFQV